MALRSVPHLLDLDAATYRRHPLHAGERDWSETNCYTDVWVELLHAWGSDPLAVGAFSLACDFEGTQWTFFKPPAEDLRDLYGVLVGEMNVWLPVFDHVAEELSLGRLLTVEVDAWALPDTAGTSYRTEHVKTTIVPQALDHAARRLGYFHAQSYYDLQGDDFDALVAPAPLPPYVELIRLPDDRPEAADLVGRSLACLRRHLTHLPATNPVSRMADRVDEELPRLAGADPSRYHLFAFATFRQCGAGAEMAASYLDWLAGETGDDLSGPATDLRRLGTGAKSAQFLLARAARGRSVDLATPLAAMAEAWDRAIGAVVSRYGG
ncbi:MAG: DUF1839 family protein [Actinomycetota bacterium]|nr:DUF1839 family protein [Actinomycetota bacterium]